MPDSDGHWPPGIRGMIMMIFQWHHKQGVGVIITSKESVSCHQPLARDDTNSSLAHVILEQMLPELSMCQKRPEFQLALLLRIHSRSSVEVVKSKDINESQKTESSALRRALALKRTTLHLMMLNVFYLQMGPVPCARSLSCIQGRIHWQPLYTSQ